MTHDLHAFARRWFTEVWNEKLDSSLDSMMAPECTGDIEGGLIRNREDFKAQRAVLLETFPDFRINVEETVAEGTSVVTRWQVTATHRGAGLGIEPTGTSVSIRGMTWMRVERGRIVHGWDSWNQGAVLETLRLEAKRLGLA